MVPRADDKTRELKISLQGTNSCPTNYLHTLFGGKPMKTFKSLDSLMSTLPVERQQRIKAQSNQTLTAIRLAELRKQLQISQTQLAEKMQVSQASISQLENQGDVQFSTLMRYVHALGGKLRIEVDMPDGTLKTLVAD
jgi:DNA-binding transcriptional regulator YiaG